jgi:transcriptional regulator with XRE-family HTH domain
MKNIGGTIKALRQEKGITLPALADQAKLSKGLLSKIENTPEANPSLDTLYKIAEALDEPVSALLETETAQLKRVVPNEAPDWQKKLVAYLKANGKQPDEQILSAMYILRNRKAADKRFDLEFWKFLYQNIENSFKTR